MLNSSLAAFFSNCNDFGLCLYSSNIGNNVELRIGDEKCEGWIQIKSQVLTVKGLFSSFCKQA
jgi:hypothetical protein